MLFHQKPAECVFMKMHLLGLIGNFQISHYLQQKYHSSSFPTRSREVCMGKGLHFSSECFWAWLCAISRPPDKSA